MKFAEFKEKIEGEYNKRFDKSLCRCRIFKCLGKSITIDFALAANEREVVSNIMDNDLMRTSFIIHLPKEWEENDDLPEMMILEHLKGQLKIKTENRNLYCDYRKITFRKTKGDADKMIKAFSRYIDRLKDALVEEYKANNLFDRDMELVREKRYAA